MFSTIFYSQYFYAPLIRIPGKIINFVANQTESGSTKKLTIQTVISDQEIGQISRTIYSRRAFKCGKFSRIREMPSMLFGCRVRSTLLLSLWSPTGKFSYFAAFLYKFSNFNPLHSRKHYLPSRSSGGKLEGGVRGAQYLINK